MPRRAVFYGLCGAVALGTLAAALFPARPGMAAPREGSAAPREESAGPLAWRGPAERAAPRPPVPEDAARAPRTDVAVEPAAFWDGQVAEIEGENDAQVEDARREASTPAKAARRAATDALPLKKRTAEAVPLARPGARDDRTASGLPPLATAAGSLAIVLALFFVTAWVLRRGAPQATLSLPRDVVEVLGRAPLPGKQQVHLLRCGQKLLLVWAGAGGVETLTEITDPAEVDRLAGICRAAHPHSATAAFRHVFQQLAREPGAELLAGGAPKRSFLTGRRTEDDDV